MKPLSFILFLFLLFSCGQTVKESGERTIFTNEYMAVQGKDMGIGENYRLFYLATFASEGADYDRVTRFQTDVKTMLEGLGARSASRPHLAKAVITGLIGQPVITTAERATNEPGLIYRMTVRYSITDYERRFLQKDRPVSEAVLVLNTNTVDTNLIYDRLYQLAARHTAEAVFYGWQLDYSKTDKTVETLGAASETNYSTNRAQ